MNHKKLETCIQTLDTFLEGGFESDIITTIYGPAGSGKTLLCIHAMISCVKNGKKVIYVDTEGGFSVERFKQVDDDYDLLLKHIYFLHPTNFEEQKVVFEKLKNLLTTGQVGLIIVDSISMLYRLELGKSDKIYEINKLMGQQISYLSEIARKKKIPVILTNQVYADFDSKEKDKVKMVGGDLLKYSSKCLIEMKKDDNKRKIVIIKHRSIKENKETEFIIDKDGMKLKC